MATAAEKRAALHTKIDALLAGEGIDPKELYRYAVEKVGVRAPSTKQAIAQLAHCHSVLTKRYQDVIESALDAATPETFAAFRARHPRAKNAALCSFENGNVVHVVVLQRIDTPTPTVWWVENEKIKADYLPLIPEQ